MNTPHPFIHIVQDDKSDTYRPEYVSNARKVTHSFAFLSYEEAVSEARSWARAEGVPFLHSVLF